MLFGGRRHNVRPHRLAGLGVARTLQGVGLYAGLTALENVMMPALIGGTSHDGARRRATELLVRVGPYRRSILLPDSLRRREVTGARLRSGVLRVTFAGDPSKNGSSGAAPTTVKHAAGRVPRDLT